MKGWLTYEHAALVAGEVLEAGGGHDFVIDTGFTGHLYVAESTIAAWGLSFVSSITITLADQGTIIADVYEATVGWLGVLKRVSVVAGPFGCDSLLGMELLEGCRIELDSLNSEVRIETLYQS